MLEPNREILWYFQKKSRNLATRKRKKEEEENTYI